MVAMGAVGSVVGWARADRAAAATVEGKVAGKAEGGLAEVGWVAGKAEDLEVEAMEGAVRAAVALEGAVTEAVPAAPTAAAHT